MYLDRTLV